MNNEKRGLQKIIADSQARIIQAKANMKFAKLTPAAKRVAIMEDVLALTRDNKGIQIQTGSYCEVDSDESSVDLQTVVNTKPSSCTVCAMGAIFLAHAHLFDQVQLHNKYGNLGAGDSTIIEALKGYFSEDQLRLIELAFEGYSVDDFEDHTMEPYGQKWKDQYDSPRLRVRAIAQNVIRNKGTFVITQVTGSRK